MSHRGEYYILITDRMLVPVGNPIFSWTSLDVTLRFNEPSSGIFEAPGYPWIRDQLFPGNRVVVIRRQVEHPSEDGTIVIAGPIEKWIYERSDDGDNAGDGRVTVDFADDMALVAGRCTYPNPAQTAAAQTTDRWTYTGNAETALRTAVNLNAGPGALTARQVPLLALGAVQSIGSTITINADRMEPLGDVLRNAAIDGGGLGFRTRQSGNQILFEVYDPPDVSDTVRFSFGLGNLKYIAYEVTAPTVTTTIVGGQGEGADRNLIERNRTADEAAWWRIEKLISRPGSLDPAELQKDGDDELEEGAETARLPSNVADSHQQRYGVHYGLGYKVAVESWPGEEIVDVVRTVHIQAWPTAGDVVSATVGSQAARHDPAWIKRMRAIDDRVGKLERTVMPAVLP